MRTLKKLCGNEKLENVVVATTRWDEFQTDGDILSAEEVEQTLTDEPGTFLKDLADEGVPFIRTGHFYDYPKSAGDRYQSPLVIVERLLGLEYATIDNQQDAELEDEPTGGAEASPLATVPNEPHVLNQGFSEHMEDVSRMDLPFAAAHGMKSEQTVTKEDRRERLENSDRLLVKLTAQVKGWEESQKVR